MIQKLNLLHQIVPTDIRLSTANNSSQDQVDSINSCDHFDPEGTTYLDHQNQKGQQQVKCQPGQFLIDFIVVEELSVP